MLGWDDVPKPANPTLPSSLTSRKSAETKHALPGSPGASSGGAAPHDEVIFADGKKAGWWQASEKGILNEADAADDKGAKKAAFVPQYGITGAQQYGSIFGARPVELVPPPPAEPTTALGEVSAVASAAGHAIADAASAATHTVVDAASAAGAAVAEVVHKIGEMDPFAELLSPGKEAGAHHTAPPAAAAATGGALPAAVAAVHAPAPPSPGGAPPASGIQFADGKKSGWWAAGDQSILNEADAADDAKGAKKSFSAQFTVTGQKNNYGSMLNWKAEEATKDAAAGTIKAGAPKADEDWDPFQSAAKP